MRVEGLIGQRFGRWTVLSIAKTGRRTYLSCRCDCGTERDVLLDGLKNGQSKSCGCLHSEIMRKLKPHTIHGQKNTKLYAVWKTMRQRCNNPNNKSYPNYGGRGIQVCKEWEGYDVFHFWAMANGYHEGLEIDRKDTNGNYCPANCRWVSHTVNADNRRSVFHYEYQEKTYNAKHLSLLLGYCEDYISCMLRLGKKIKTIEGGKIIWQQTA